MAMFDFLKVLIHDKKAPARPKADTAVIQIDSRTYPLVTLTAKGFVAGEYDNTVAEGQMAAITVKVDDRCGKFSFNARVTITSVNANKQFGASFGILPPEVEQALATYAKNKKAAPGPARKG